MNRQLHKTLPEPRAFTLSDAVKVAHAFRIDAALEAVYELPSRTNEKPSRVEDLWFDLLTCVPKSG